MILTLKTQNVFLSHLGLFTCYTDILAWTHKYLPQEGPVLAASGYQVPTFWPPCQRHVTEATKVFF